MSRNGVVKVLLVVAVPVTGLAYVAAREYASSVPQPAYSPGLDLPYQSLAPLDLRFEQEPPTISVQDLPVYVEPKQQPAPAPVVNVEPEPPPPPPKIEEREVLAGHAAHQTAPSRVRMWGVHAPDTNIAEDGARRSASELSRHYRGESERPNFERVGISSVSAEAETKD